jgi:hypothetical protein
VLNTVSCYVPAFCPFLYGQFVAADMGLLGNGLVTIKIVNVIVTEPL